MKLFSQSITDGSPINEEFAFGAHDAVARVRLTPNSSPQLSWSDVPAETQSFVLLMHDRDVPSQPDNVNQDGKTVPYALARVDFFHWVLVDLPKDIHELPAGSGGRGVVPKGKPGPEAMAGARHGINDFTAWFQGDTDMEGNYFGYDGPCPPWNDERLHHYVFTLYALDVPTCDVSGVFTGHDVRAAIAGHVLAEASIEGTYHIYPEARL